MYSRCSLAGEAVVKYEIDVDFALNEEINQKPLSSAIKFVDVKGGNRILIHALCNAK